MVLTDKEWYAFMAGLIVGKHIKKDGNTNIDNAATVNKKPIKTSKYATIGITAQKKKLDSRVGQTVTSNIMCTGVNIGVSAFVAKITWDSYLTYTGVDYGDFGSNLSIDDSKALTERTLLVLGQNTTNMSINDFILFKINFNMSTIPDNVDYVNINCIKTTGTTMIDCSLLTIKDANLYYITPIEANNGYFYFDSDDKPVEPVPEISLPGPSNFPIGSGGSSSGGYSLSGYLGGAGGSGAYIIVEIWQNGILVGSDRQWVTSGNFNIKGNIGISNPNPGYGDVSIKIKVEPDPEDDTPYYILIPAGGFNIVFTTIVNKGDKTFPKEPIIVQYVESLELLDLYDMEIISNEPVDLDANMEEITLIDDSQNDLIGINIIDNVNTDNIGILDDYAIDIESPPVPVDLDANMDSVELNDINDNAVISIVKYDRDTLEELGLNDINENSIITTIITELSENETINITDLVSLD